MGTDPIDSRGQAADENLSAAVSSAQTGAVVLSTWQSAMQELRGMYEENGFGRDIKKIWMMSVRES